MGNNSHTWQLDGYIFLGKVDISARRRGQDRATD